TGTTGSYGPITVTACSLGSKNGMVASNALNIKYFNNTGDRTVTAVTFHVRYHGVDQRFTDTGSFAAGAKVNHTFNYFGGSGWSGPFPSVCSVTSVQFKSGQVLHI
ncbi:MAG TPA: hypothetical protein VKG44_07855, partial [Candidatus Baltobacteraceae bacterium]|nr:hypothetical protein [Candidatus Baltobacteraceae bacterium]